jgi:hypothetical protein
MEYQVSHVNIEYEMLQSDNRFKDAGFRSKTWDAGVRARRTTLDLRIDGRLQDMRVSIPDDVTG